MASVLHLIVWFINGLVEKTLAVKNTEFIMSLMYRRKCHNKQKTLKCTFQANLQDKKGKRPTITQKYELFKYDSHAIPMQMKFSYDFLY